VAVSHHLLIKEEKMAAAAVDSYYDLAIRYQTLREAADQTPVWKEYRASIEQLHRAFDDCRITLPNVVKKLMHFRFETTDAKALRKAAKWEALPPAVDQDPPIMAISVKDFERCYLATLADPTIKAARKAKLEFRKRTLEFLAADFSVDNLQYQLKGLSDRVVAKVSYWSVKYYKPYS
jgi:hypothetical protein